MPWIPNGPLMRARRLELGLSRAQVGKRAGVDEKTIARIERGEVAPQLRTFHAVATSLALHKDVAGHFVPYEESQGTGWAAKLPKGMLAAQAKAFKDQADQEARSERAARKDLRRIGDLTVRAIEDVTTAWAPHKGRRFRFKGWVEEQVAVTNPERIALGASLGVGVRFRVRCETPDGDTVHITLYAGNIRHTRKLQAALGEAEPVVAVMRVLVVESAADHATGSGGPPMPAEYFRNHWKGFSHFGDQRATEWAFVMGAEGPEGPKPEFRPAPGLGRTPKR